MSVTVSEKGQVTIPKMLRERLGIRAGDELEFVEEEGRLVAKRVTREDPVDRVFGILRIGSTDERIEELRGKADTV